MTRSLRKRHLQIWTALAILLPAGIISAWMVIPDTQYIKAVNAEAEYKLPEIYRTLEQQSYTVSLRTNPAHNAWQLDWKNNCVLNVPSAVIYAFYNSGEKELKQTLVGRIESKGSYLFALPGDSATNPPLHFMLYDFIHEQAIDTIHFK